jgi:hypothetical protein
MPSACFVDYMEYARLLGRLPICALLSFVINVAFSLGSYSMAMPQGNVMPTLNDCPDFDIEADGEDGEEGGVAIVPATPQAMNVGANVVVSPEDRFNQPAQAQQFDAVADGGQQVPLVQQTQPVAQPPIAPSFSQPIIQPLALPNPMPNPNPNSTPEPMPTAVPLPPPVQKYNGSGIATPDITISNKQSVVLRGDRDYYIIESPSQDCPNQKVICLPSGRVYFFMSLPTANEIAAQKKNLQNIGTAEPPAYQQMTLPFQW